MPLTPYRGFSPPQSQQYAAQVSSDPENSPIAKLRKSPSLAAQFGYDPSMLEKQYQYGMAQQQSATAPAYGNAIPSMRKNLMQLPTSRAQY